MHQANPIKSLCHATELYDCSMVQFHDDSLIVGTTNDSALTVWKKDSGEYTDHHVDMMNPVFERDSNLNISGHFNDILTNSIYNIKLWNSIRLINSTWSDLASTQTDNSKLDEIYKNNDRGRRIRNPDMKRQFNTSAGIDKLH